MTRDPAVKLSEQDYEELLGNWQGRVGRIPELGLSLLQAYNELRAEVERLRDYYERLLGDPEFRCSIGKPPGRITTLLGREIWEDDPN